MGTESSVQISATDWTGHLFEILKQPLTEAFRVEAMAVFCAELDCNLVLRLVIEKTDAASFVDLSQPSVNLAKFLVGASFELSFANGH